MPLIDITLTITPQMREDAQQSGKTALIGHLGTHFDVMNKEFPLAYTQRSGIVFDVSTVKERDIGIEDIAVDTVEDGMFVAFYTGFVERVGYTGGGYFSAHPQLSYELIETLLEKGVSIIGVDFAGIRRGKEHTPIDQRCADKDTFVIENLCNLKAVLDADGRFIANTYPLKAEGLTGLPCRVIAQIP